MPHPHASGPQSQWDRSASLNNCGAVGLQRPPKQLLGLPGTSFDSHENQSFFTSNSTKIKALDFLSFLSFSLEQGSGAPSLRPAERAVSRGELRGGVRPAAQPEHEAGHRGWEVTPGRGLGLSRPGISCGLASEDEDLTSVDEDLASVDDSVLLSSRGGCLEGAAPRLRSGAPEGRSSLRV